MGRDLGSLGHVKIPADWHGPIAFVLACGVAISLCASIIIVSIRPGKIDPELVAVLTALAGAAVGAVGTYLGAAGHGAPKSSRPAREQEDPVLRLRDDDSS